MNEQHAIPNSEVRLYPVMSAIDKLHQVVTLYPETLRCQELAKVANLLEVIHDVFWGTENIGYPLHREKLQEIVALFRDTPHEPEKGVTRDINRFVRLTNAYLGHYLTLRETEMMPFTIFIVASSILKRSWV